MAISGPLKRAAKFRNTLTCIFQPITSLIHRVERLKGWRHPPNKEIFICNVFKEFGFSWYASRSRNTYKYIVQRAILEYYWSVFTNFIQIKLQAQIYPMKLTKFKLLNPQPPDMSRTCDVSKCLTALFIAVTSIKNTCCGIRIVCGWVQ